MPPAALDIPRHGWVNLHFSLLPAWRGAAPVQHAIMAGDEMTGADHLPAGGGAGHRPGLRHRDRADPAPDTAGDLLGRLALSGAGLLVATLDGIEDGELVAEPQPVDGVSLAPQIETADAASTGACPPSWSTGGCAVHPGARRLDDLAR